MPKPADADYWEARQLLYFQAASVGPMFGQRMHFSYLAPEDVPYAITRFEAEGARLHNVMDKMLDGRDYFLTSGYSMVDIAVFGWYQMAALASYEKPEHTNLAAWLKRVADRPAVQVGLGVPMRRDASQLPPRKVAS